MVETNDKKEGGAVNSRGTGTRGENVGDRTDCRSYNLIQLTRHVM